MLASDGFLVLIPAYNEALNIENTVSDVLEHCGNVEILVVNDGSVDKTAEIACKAGAKVLSLPVNLGIGGAVQTGFLYALRYGYQYVIRMDADGQHRAKDVALISLGLLEGADIVVGSRFILKEGFQSKPLRKIGIKLIAWLCRILNDGLWIGDPTSGFRGYSRKALSLFEKWYPVDYPEPEELIVAANGHCKIIEVPVTMAPRVRGHSSIGGWVSFFYVIKVVLAAFIEKSRGKYGPR